jgi:hypothetical protein
MQYVLMTMMAAWPLAAPPEAPMPTPTVLTAPKTTSPEPDLLAAMPEDPLQRIAYRAVVLKEWPDTPQWKLDAYRIVLDRDIKLQGTARRTTYCPSCSGTTCADGSPVRDGICAASPNIPMHALVWLASDGLLKVCDRGGAVKVNSGCRARGETANFDVWVPQCAGGCWTGPGTMARVPWAMVAIW